MTVINYDTLDPLSKSFYDMFSAMGCSQSSIEEFMLSFRADEDYAFEQLIDENPDIDIFTETDE